MPLIKNPNNPLNQPVALSNVFWFFLVLILVVSNIFLGIKYLNAKDDLKSVRTKITIQESNTQILEFTKLFIDEVLKSETEVNFEIRLKLENAVRSLGDDDILSHWQRFVQSQDEIQAQIEVKNLLGILIEKIRIN